MKRAKFIDRNNLLRQEFSFANSETLIQLHQIYHADFSGSAVWDVFCREQEMLENSYIAAIRLMRGLPHEAHRCFLEPLSGEDHIKKDLIKWFLSFVREN